MNRRTQHSTRLVRHEDVVLDELRERGLANRLGYFRRADAVAEQEETEEHVLLTAVRCIHHEFIASGWTACGTRQTKLTVVVAVF